MNDNFNTTIEYRYSINTSPKLLILGYKRSGKDTVAEYFRDNFGMTFQSSSMSACEIFLFDALKDKYGYKTIEDCYNDRVNHRAEWYDLIKEYNKDDKAKLAREILNKTGCYVGMRDREELNASRYLFDLIIWVDSEQRVGKEDITSCNITKDDADIIIQNNGTLEELQVKLQKLGKCLFI